MDLELEGKGVIVTGASRGIGRAIALAFAAEGANLAVCARGEQGVAKVAEELRAKGAKVHGAACDVADPKQLDKGGDAAYACLRMIELKGRFLGGRST